MKQFKGRPVAAGKCTAKALVSHNGFNTLASFQKSLQFGDKTAKCGDQNNPDLFGKPMVGTALCLPQTIGSDDRRNGSLLRKGHGQNSRLPALLGAYRLARGCRSYSLRSLD